MKNKTKKDHPFFTILTPTFNRRVLLQRSYEGLKHQEPDSFEWLIIDDGSSDDTAEWVESIQKESPFPVNYYRKENGGKHTAVNFGVQKANGSLIVILDSDDVLVEDSIAIFRRHWLSIPEDERDGYDGVCGLFADPRGEVIGDRFPEDRFVSNYLDLKFKHHVSGDKLSALRREVMREFPFPEGDWGFIPESYVWIDVARKYKSLYVNDIVGVAEYQSDGLTKTGASIKVENPLGALLYNARMMEISDYLSLKETIKVHANYVRFLCHTFSPARGAETVPAPVGRSTMARLLLTFPVGVGLYIRDILKAGGAPQTN